MECLKQKISQCEKYTTMMREDLVANEKHLYNLYIELQMMEAVHSNTYEDSYNTGKISVAEFAEFANFPALEDSRQKELAELSLKEELFVNQPVGTKLKWVLNEETYRVAIVTKNGVLQVKAVEDGCGECHDEGCSCGPCWEHLHDAPWRPRLPLKKTFFESEAEWRNSLPFSGEVIVTRPHINEKVLKQLCCAPLTAITDVNKMKELQDRFPGGTFVLSTDNGQVEIEYFFHSILCRKKGFAGANFSDLGIGAHEKPTLMVEWRGMYIGLSHLLQ
jgi:hypothetical protein